MWRSWIRPFLGGMLGLSVYALSGAALAQTTTETGGLVCERIEGTGRNLIITSKAQVRCLFRGRDGAEQWYVGETGVGFGLDLKWNKEETIRYGVLSSTRQFTPEGDFLSGKYAGAKADAALGVGVGAAVLLGGSGKTTALKPAVETSTGAGLALGVGYLNLESDPLNNARMALPRGAVFGQALYSNYFNQAYDYYQGKHYLASDEFASRAIRAAGVEDVTPMAVPDGNQAPGQTGDMADFRGRLVAALDDPLSDYAPGDAAGAQVSYDCWVYGVVHGLPVANVENCRTVAQESLSALEARVAAEQRVIDAEERLMQPRWYTIYFATDSASIEPYAQRVLSEVKVLLRDLERANVFAGGHTDRVGSYQYNAVLSEKRAASVRDALVEAGVPVEWIKAEGYAQRNPVRIATNAHDALNRRVEIVIEPLAVTAEALERARAATR